MNLRRLRYFTVVAEELHFGRAATRLHVSQPALSHQIRKLEETIGVRLLDRNSRHVALTDAGRDVLREARALLAAAEHLEEVAAGHVARAARAPLVVGFTGTAASRLLPRILTELRDRTPEASVELRELNAVRYDLLRTGKLDVVLGRLRPEEMPDLDVHVLEREPRVAVLPSSHPLARRRSLRLAELADDAFITQPAALNPSFRQAWLAEQQAAGLPGRIAAEATSVSEFLNLVAARRGVCLAPATASEFTSWPGVSFVPVDDVTSAATSIVTRRERPAPPLRAFLDAATVVASGRNDVVGAQPEVMV